LLLRLNNLRKKTSGIFKTPGKRIYHLDIYRNGMISIDNLKYLFSLIFKEKTLLYEERNEIIEFFKESTYKNHHFVFDSEKHIFSEPEFDDIIEEVLFSL
ncbi:MAG: hypothetical protein ACTSVV_06810, partial [Promethearchaeota archaeon]